jgi:hypothetical protein
VLVATGLIAAPVAFGTTPASSRPTRSSPEVSAGTVALQARRESSNRIAITVRYTATVLSTTEIQINYDACPGTRADPRCGNRGGHGSFGPMLVHPGRRVLSVTRVVSHPKAAHTSCVTVELLDVYPGHHDAHILGPTIPPVMVCP